MILFLPLTHTSWTHIRSASFFYNFYKVRPFTWDWANWPIFQTGMKSITQCDVPPTAKANTILFIMYPFIHARHTTGSSYSLLLPVLLTLSSPAHVSINPSSRLSTTLENRAVFKAHDSYLKLSDWDVSLHGTRLSEFHLDNLHSRSDSFLFVCFFYFWAASWWVSPLHKFIWCVQGRSHQANTSLVFKISQKLTLITQFTKVLPCLSTP